MNQSSDILKKNIIVELGLQDLGEERKRELLIKMSDLIQRRVLLRTIRNLSIEDKGQLKAMLKRNDPQEIYRFLIFKNPDIEQITDEEMIKFKEEILKHVKSLNF